MKVSFDKCWSCNEMYLQSFLIILKKMSKSNYPHMC